MISPKTIDVGHDAVDLAEGTGLSGVQILGVVNDGKRRLWLGEVGNGYPIEPGGRWEPNAGMGSTDKLHLVREGSAKARPEKAHILIGYSA